jgi:hypothetical protein
MGGTRRFRFDGGAPRRRTLRRLVVAAVVMAIATTAGCSSGSEDGSGADGDGGDDPSAGSPAGAPMAGPPSREGLSVPEIEGPITGGQGRAVLGPPGFDLETVGYTEEEFFVSGTASTFSATDPLSEDGRWDVTPEEGSDFTTRVVVRRPAEPGDFSGTVVVEWLNVSGGLDAAPDWTFIHNEVTRSGAAWVGVSAQEAGIEGGGNSLGAALALKNADAERYASLDHPGDDHSYDIFSQVGAAVWFRSGVLLDGAEPQVVVAMGESQSAFRLTTYVNALAALHDVYDGYLVHSRAGRGAPLVTEPTPVEAPDPTLSRTDLEVPVLVLSAETDLVGDRLGYARARQPDSDWFASWEMAGTAHIDAYGLGIGDSDDGSGTGDSELFNAMQDPPSSVYFDVIECSAPINTGPQTYVTRAAYSALVTWATEGTAPPEMPRLQLDPTGKDLVRDDLGNAVGGVRTPHVDVPIAVLSGMGQEDDNFCRLFGTTRPLDADVLAERYPDHATFVRRWNAALDAAVDAGAILETDADRLRSVAEDSAIGR